MSSLTEIKPHTSGQFPDLKIFIFQNQEDDKQKQRQLLRKTLSEALLTHSFSAPKELLDLLALPTHPELSISLSHGSAYSALAWCLRPDAVGLDVEDLHKVRSQTVARVSSQSEQSLAPRLDLLWSCKEAVFKAISPRAKTLSFVEIFDWKLLGDETWSFRAREAHSQVELRGQGEVRLILGHSLAFFIFFS